MKLHEPVASLHKDLVKRWVALVADPKRRLDEHAHIGMAQSWAQHEKQNLKGVA